MFDLHRRPRWGEEPGLPFDPGVTHGDPPAKVGNRRELFVNLALVDRLVGVSQVIHRPQPALQVDVAWLVPFAGS